MWGTGGSSSTSRKSSRERAKAVRERFEQLKAKAIYIALSPYRLFKFLCFSIGLVVVILATGVSLYLYTFFGSMPDLDRMKFDSVKAVAEKKIQSRLYDKSKRYKWTKINEVSRDYLYTLVMSEDSSFFEHKGVNYDAIINSLAENIKRRSYDFGASTISQQVTKNLFLSEAKTLVRKVQELLVTQDLERYFSKNEILELYFNVAEFGPDIIGVNAAAHYYFGKSPSKINAAEGAFIALMLPSPRRNHYAIYQNGNLTSTRRKKLRRVLRDMLYNEFISQRQYKEYINYKYFREKGRDPSGRLSGGRR